MGLADDLHQWAGSDDSAREACARESAERVGIAFEELATFSQGGQRHVIALGSADDAQWALIPGGDVPLGHEPGSFEPTKAQLSSYAGTQEEYGLPPIDEFLAESLARPRTVHLDPMWVEVRAKPVGRGPVPPDDPGGVGGVVHRGDGESYSESPVAPVECRPGPDDRWRLPTADEWEWACRGGTTTLFRWGDDCPADRPPITPEPEDENGRQNAFGLFIATDPYDWEVTAESSIAVGGDGGGFVCGGAGFFVSWLPLASSWRTALVAEEPTFGLHRRRCVDASGA